MTRIISGFAGSLSLAVPGAGTRPTSDRVREAMFSALESVDALVGASVLDLYAGSGALGLEAVSRGAASVVLVESASNAAAACRRNAAHVLASAPPKAPPIVTVEARAVQAFLASGSSRFTLAFLDPPYDLDAATLEKDLALLVPRLEPNATVLVERSSRSPELSLPQGLEVDRHKRYGDTTVWWFTN